MVMGHTNVWVLLKNSRWTSASIVGWGSWQRGQDFSEIFQHQNKKNMKAHYKIQVPFNTHGTWKILQFLGSTLWKPVKLENGGYHPKLPGHNGGGLGSVYQGFLMTCKLNRRLKTGTLIYMADFFFHEDIFYFSSEILRSEICSS